MNIVLMHGLEGSPSGSKATYLRTRFPTLVVPDGRGLPLAARIDQLREATAAGKDWIGIGSSYGGLALTAFVQSEAARFRALLLLAPALIVTEPPVDDPNSLVIPPDLPTTSNVSSRRPSTSASLYSPVPVWKKESGKKVTLMHIGKSAGTSFRSALERAMSRLGSSCNCPGHQHFGLLDKPQNALVTMLRHRGVEASEEGSSSLTDSIVVGAALSELGPTLDGLSLALTKLELSVRAAAVPPLRARRRA